MDSETNVISNIRGKSRDYHNMRSFARLIDLVIIIPLYTLSIKIFLYLQYNFAIVKSSRIAFYAILAILIIVPYLYLVVFQTIATSTVGKFLFRMRIKNRDNTHVGIFKMTIRYFLAPLSLILPVPFMPYKYIDGNFVAFHDQVTGTLVYIKEKQGQENSQQEQIS